MKRFIRLNDVYRRSYTVSFEDMDPEYRLKVTSAAAYFQDTVAAFMASRFIAAFDIVKDGILWVVSEVAYSAGEREAMWGETLNSEVRLSEYSTFRLYFDFALKGDDGTVFATGTGIWAPVALETGKPLPISDFCEIREPLDDTPAVKHGRFRYLQAEVPVMEASYPVTHSELDFNKHMGNRSYLEFALRGIPDDFKDSHSLSSFMARYARQTYLGDTVTCRYFQPAGTEYSHLVKLCNSAGEEVCQIQLTWTDRPLQKVDFSEIAPRR